jgi:hypothetical protein
MAKDKIGAVVAHSKVLSRNLPQWTEECHEKFVSSATTKPGTSRMRRRNDDCYTTAFDFTAGKTVLSRLLTRGTIYISLREKMNAQIVQISM